MQQSIDGIIRVLHVDDEPGFRDLTAEFLEMEYDQIEVLSAESAAEGVERFHAESDIDCIVSDYDMPGTNGIGFLQTIREEDPEFPFILYTGKGSEEIASDAISAGVTEYLQKGSGSSQYTVLANRITNAVEQYRSKRAIEQSQKRLSLFVEQSPFAVVEWDENFEVARINDKVEEILGYSEEELIGEPWETIVPESDQDAVGEVVSELLEAQGGYHSINENVRADGERLICEWHNRVVTDEDDETVAIFSQFQDITDRRNRRQQLELRNHAINEAPVGITMTDPAQEDNPIIFANDQFVEYTGYSREEMMGENHRLLQTPETREEPVAAMREAIDNNEPVTVELRNSRKDGTVWWNRVSIAPIHDDDGSVQNYVGFQEDVTERRQNEERLSTVARRFEAIFENPPTLIVLLHPDGTLIDANQTSLDFIDAPEDEVTGTKFWNTPWWTHSETLQEQLQDRITRAADGEYVRFGAKHPTPDGEIALIDGLIHPVRDDTGAITELVAIGRDTTEQKAHERELEQTNAVLSALVETLPVGVLQKTPTETSWRSIIGCWSCSNSPNHHRSSLGRIVNS
jgi:PAS domain S-box-containing protein